MDVVDWTMEGAVTAVNNEGHWGSRWAFSTTDSHGDAWFIAAGKLSLDTADSSCRGGLMDNGLAFGFELQRGIAQGSVAGYIDVFTVSEQALMSTVARQPVSSTFEADQSLFKSFSSGGRCPVPWWRKF